VYRTDLGNGQALTLIKKLNEYTLLNDQYLVAYSRKLTAMGRRCADDRNPGRLKMARAAQRNLMTYSAQEFASGRFLE
jgi:hypothetical protein